MTAAASLAESRDATAVLGWGGLHTCIHAALLPCAAHARDWKAWDEGFAFVSAVLRKTGLTEPDLAWAVSLSADLADAAGEEGRAAAARGLAAPPRGL